MASQTFAFQFLLNPGMDGTYTIRDERPGAPGNQPLNDEVRVRGIGDDKRVLGSEDDDAFRVGSGRNAQTFEYSGTMTDASGGVIGIVGERDGLLFLFTDRTTLSASQPLTVNAPGEDGSNNWDLRAGIPVCFMPGTLVATPGGEVRVEDLRAGDLVLTDAGDAEPVRWIGRQTVSRIFGDPTRVLPIRVRAGALGGGMPRRDLLVSPDHALLVGDLLVQAGALVNGSSVVREEDVPLVFTYFHVELRDHALLLAEGVPAETFVDNVARMAFDNWAEHEAAADPAPMVELDLPRVRSARQLPDAIRAELDAIAATIAPGMAKAA